MVGTISRDELKNKILKGERLQLVETLPEDKFREQHLPGAVNLPPAEIKQRARQILPDRNESIVVYCGSESCTASLDAARE